MDLYKLLETIELFKLVKSSVNCFLQLISATHKQPLSIVVIVNGIAIVICFFPY